MEAANLPCPTCGARQGFDPQSGIYCTSYCWAYQDATLERMRLLYDAITQESTDLDPARIVEYKLGDPSIGAEGRALLRQVADRIRQPKSSYKILAPLPKGVDDSPENRQRLQALCVRLKETKS